MEIRSIEEMKEYERPPLGVMPKWMWLEIRGLKLTRAIHRYLDQGNHLITKKDRYRHIKSWINELKEVIEELDKQ